MSEPRRAIIYVAWDRRFIDEAVSSLQSRHLPKYDSILVTDQESEVPSSVIRVIRKSFSSSWHHRKAEVLRALPPGYDTYLFLDSDALVIGDITLGFEKAEQFGMAMAPAPRYSLDARGVFRDIMKREGIEPAGQLLYNSGVIFLSPTPEVLEVLDMWVTLIERYQNELKNDQPFLSLALEKLHFNPYTLSPNYNYRGIGELASGTIRVWHSRLRVPHNVNDVGIAVAPRRVLNGKVLYPRAGIIRWKLQKLGRKLAWKWRQVTGRHDKSGQLTCQRR